MRPVVPPKLITRVIHFAPTNIGLPCNAGIAARTIWWGGRYSANGSPERLERELQLVSAGRKFQQALRLSGGVCRSTFLCHCL